MATLVQFKHIKLVNVKSNTLPRELGSTTDVNYAEFDFHSIGFMAGAETDPNGHLFLLFQWKFQTLQLEALAIFIVHVGIFTAQIFPVFYQFNLELLKFATVFWIKLSNIGHSFGAILPPGMIFLFHRFWHFFDDTREAWCSTSSNIVRPQQQKQQPWRLKEILMQFYCIIGINDLGD